MNQLFKRIIYIILVVKIESMIKYLLIFLVCSIGLSLEAQTVFQPKPLTDNLKGVLYDRELTFDFTLHTNGYALGVTVGNLATYYRTNFYYIGIGELKHQKEFRQNFKLISNQTGQSSNSFIFGKQNNLFVIRAGKGVKRFFSEKAKEKGVAVSMTLEGGPTLGLLKPYYLEIARINDNTGGAPRLESVRYSEETADLFLNTNVIFGASSLAQGLNELRLIPGLHGKVAANFEWGTYDEFIKSAEIGLMLDLFPRKVPIMVTETNRAFFLNLYITLQLGKRS